MKSKYNPFVPFITIVAITMMQSASADILPTLADGQILTLEDITASGGLDASQFENSWFWNGITTKLTYAGNGPTTIEELLTKVSVADNVLSINADNAIAQDTWLGMPAKLDSTKEYKLSYEYKPTNGAVYYGFNAYILGKDVANANVDRGPLVTSWPTVMDLGGGWYKAEGPVASGLTQFVASFRGSVGAYEVRNIELVMNTLPALADGQMLTLEDITASGGLDAGQFENSWFWNGMTTNLTYAGNGPTTIAELLTKVSVADNVLSINADDSIAKDTWLGMPANLDSTKSYTLTYEVKPTNGAHYWSLNFSLLGRDDAGASVDRGDLTSSNAWAEATTDLGGGWYKIVGTVAPGMNQMVVSLRPAENGNWEVRNIALTETADPNLVSAYGAWQSANFTSQTADLDHDNDGIANGVEHFLGGIANTTGNSNPLPSVINAAGTLSVTWVRDPGFSGFPANYGTAFLVETSATLADPWTPAAQGIGAGFVQISGDNVTYTFPTGTRSFARLKVIGALPLD